MVCSKGVGTIADMASDDTVAESGGDVVPAAEEATCITGKPGDDPTTAGATVLGGTGSTGGAGGERDTRAKEKRRNIEPKLVQKH